jgi:hypothetical protein
MAGRTEGVPMHPATVIINNEPIAFIVTERGVAP